MLFLFEIKKLIKNRAISVSALILLALTAALALRSAANAEQVFIDSAEAAQAYEAFALDTENKAATALRRAKSAYAAEYYSAAKEEYRAARERIEFKSGCVTGWDELLSFDAPLFAGLFMSVMLGAAAFYEDRRIGMASVIAASKNGRRRLAADRMLAAILLSALFALAAAGITFICFKTAGTLQNGGFVLQSAPSFFHSAEKLTLGRAFVILALRRLPVCAAVTAGACLVSKLMRGYIPILLVSAAFPVMEFAAFSLRYNAADVLLKNANVFAYGSGYLLERFYRVRLFGAVRPEALVFDAAAGLIISLSGLAVFLPERGSGAPKKLLRLPERIKLPHMKARPHGLFAWEFAKLLRAPAVLIPVCLCLGLGVWGILKNAPLKQSEGEKLYRGYCAEFSGKSFFEIDGLIAEEEGGILSANARMDEADRLYDNGQMDFDEYNAVSAEYIDCLRREGLLPVLRARLYYLIGTSAKLNTSLDYVYDTGLNKLIGLENGILPMLAVILLACCPFLKERESGFINLLRTGKNGRGRIYLVRLAFVLLCALAVTLLFSAAELYALSGDGIFESLKTPAASLEALRKMGTTSIGAYLCNVFAMRLAAALCMALVTYALSTRFESPFAVLAPALGWLLVSFALRRLGVSFPPADISAFVSGHAAFAKAGQAAWLNMLPLIAITVLFVAYSYRRFTRTVK